MRSSSTAPVNPSYWALTAVAAVDRAPLPERSATDVVVIGGGITGLTTALLLKRAGRRVVLLEAGRVGEGVTGYSTAKLTSLHSLTYARLEAQEGETATRSYAAASQWGIEKVASLVEELAIDCQFERRPAITFTIEADAVENVEDEVAAAKRAGLEAELIGEADLPFPIAAGIQLRDQASFHPLRYCIALAEAVDGDGCAVHEGARAVDVDEDEAGHLTVATADDRAVLASHVVLACGLPFLDRGGFFARMHPSRSYCVALEAEGDLPRSMSISTGGPTRSIRPITGPAGEKLLLLAGEEHKVGQAADTPERYARLEAFARRHFPVGELAARWSSQDYIPVDGLPLVGHVPMAHSQLYVATGFRKWGLTTGTASARIIADLILGEENPWTSLFDAGRSQLPEGAGEALAENANVVKRFVGDRLRQRKAPSVESLAPGAGAICRQEGEAVAAYRDEEGRLHLHSPVCTHMGCRVTWNAAEKSWDCPCHGSRFSTDGEVLMGPAVSRLAPR